jgi:hypothetical protein
MRSISKVSVRRKRRQGKGNNCFMGVVALVTGILAIGIVLVPFITNPEMHVLQSANMAIKATTLRSFTSSSKHSSIEEQEELSKEERLPDAVIEQSERHKDGRNDDYHTVFSSGCSTFQDWQSYVFFYHLLHSGQEGPVTRIASGCSPKDAAALREIFDTEIATMAPGRFRLHLTPDFSTVKHGTRFKYVCTCDSCLRYRYSPSVTCYRVGTTAWMVCCSHTFSCPYSLINPLECCTG